MRKIKFTNDEQYHVYNRGIDKNKIFIDRNDKKRFFDAMSMFNTTDPIGSMHEFKYQKKDLKHIPLVHFISYSLLDNHFHFILKQNVENGISLFIKKLCGGYSWYFNNKYNRSGFLFQGPFKAIHIHNNDYLLYVSAYVNLNDKQDMHSDLVAKNEEAISSSWNEYINPLFNNGICSAKNIILDQFSTCDEYKIFALGVLEEIRQNKRRYKLLGDQVAKL